MASSPGSGRIGRILLLAAVGVGAVVIGGRLLVEFYVELLWFGEVGYLPVFWKLTVWTWATRVVLGVVVAGVVFLNLRLVARTMGGIQIKRRFGNLEISEKLPRSYVIWGMFGLSALLGLWFGMSVTPGNGLRLLLSLHGEPWGLAEPILGRDVAFYVYLLPILRAAATLAVVTVFVTFTVCVGGYAATGSVQWGKGGVVMGNLPRVHLGALLALFLLLIGVQLELGRYVLLQFGNSDVQSIFGFADAQARLPGKRVLALLNVGAAGLIFWGALRNRLVPVLSGVGMVVVGSLVIGSFWPGLVQRFRVEPNELVRETPYIRYNIDFSRFGFGLAPMERERFVYAAPEDAGGVDWAGARDQFEGLPVWTSNTLLRTFNELEARFRYYEFARVDVDRYATPGAAGSRLEPIQISVREVDPTGIEDPSWQNLRIRERYIAGMGAVAVAATERTAEGRPQMYLSAIPPDFAGSAGAPPGLELTRPSVFVGGRRQGYAILNPTDSAFLDAMGVPGIPGEDYPEGILLDSPLRTVALAWRFQDANLLFAGEITDSSRFVFRRQVGERVARIAPFFDYPEPPYPVVHEGRIVWILEGFTTSRSFPLARPYELSFRSPATYVRNSVKVTVDALTGETRFYALPGEDPYLDAFRSAFPDLFTPFEEMPPGLREHLRYSKTHLELQSRVLLQYHQNTAPQFHGQQDVWDLPQEQSQSTTPVGYEPEYGIYRLPGDDETDFHLTTLFVPRGRQNLTAILAGSLGADGTRRLGLYDVPVEDQVPGPRQVEALVEQDPEISQQFSLWRTGGSQVWTGHLHLVPVGPHLLYMEPVFLAAEADAIPQLRGFVVSDGNRVVMEPTLEGAVVALSGGEAPPAPADTARPAADVGREGAAPEGVEAGVPATWPREALDLLDRAEERLRQGDYTGFGAALAELRELLEELGAGTPSGPGGGR